MSNVVDFNTRDGIVGPGVRVEPEAVLESAKGVVTEVLVIGFDGTGHLYLAGSGDHREALWLMETGKRWLLNQSMGEE